MPVCVSICACLCVCTSVYACVCVCMYACVCLCVSVHARLCVYLYVCVPVCVCMCVQGLEEARSETRRYTEAKWCKVIEGQQVWGSCHRAEGKDCAVTGVTGEITIDIVTGVPGALKPQPWEQSLVRSDLPHPQPRRLPPSQSWEGLGFLDDSDALLLLPAYACSQWHSGLAAPPLCWQLSGENIALYSCLELDEFFGYRKL